MNDRTQYAADFETNLLNGKCKVEIVIDLETLKGEAYLHLISAFGRETREVISLDQLQILRNSISSIQKKIGLLDTLPSESADHQLNCSAGIGTLIVVNPTKKAPRYVLHIGRFHREGLLIEFSSAEIDSAIAKMEQYLQLTIDKVKAA